MKRWLAAAVAAFLLTAAAFALSDYICWPEASGIRAETDGRLTVDMSGASDGYLMAKAEAGSGVYKLRIRFGENTLTYQLNSAGEYEVFPLQYGSGTYSVSLYEGNGGKKFAAAGTVQVSAELKSEDAAFLVPSQMVCYGQESEAVALSDMVCAGCTTDRERFEAVRAYVAANFSYDFPRTFSVEPDTLPDMDYCLREHKGVGLDLAALTACMLRVQGIPVRFAAGYLGRDAHAWNIVLLDGQEVLYDPAAEVGAVAGGEYVMERYY